MNADVIASMVAVWVGKGVVEGMGCDEVGEGEREIKVVAMGLLTDIGVWMYIYWSSDTRTEGT